MIILPIHIICFAEVLPQPPLPLRERLLRFLRVGPVSGKLQTQTCLQVKQRLIKRLRFGKFGKMKQLVPLVPLFEGGTL